MAKLTKLPSQAIIDGFKGTIDYYVYKGIPCARSWPKSPGKDRNSNVMRGWQPFSEASSLWDSIPADLRQYYQFMSAGTKMSARDIFIKSYLSRWHLDIPLEHAPKPVPISHYWALINHHLGMLDNGFCLSTESSRPCALTMYHTVNPLRTHPVSRTVRGLTMPWSTHYCFDFPTPLPPTPDDDVVLRKHTVTGLTAPVTVNCALAGTVNGTPSPSISPVFQVKFTPFCPFENRRFTFWPDDLYVPPFWTLFTFGTGFGELIKNTEVYRSLPWAPTFKVGGYAYGMGLQQIIQADNYRGQSINFFAYGKGLAYSNNSLYVNVDGTGGWGRFSTIRTTGVWEQHSVAGTIPWDATQIRLQVRGYSPGYGPIYTTWDDIFAAFV